MELMVHIGPLGKNKHGGSDMEDIKSFSRLPFDMDRFAKNIRYVLDKLAALEESDYRELHNKAKRVVVDEVSDWLVDKEDMPVGENVDGENPFVDDMGLE